MKLSIMMTLSFILALGSILTMNTAQGQSLDYESVIQPIFTNNCTSKGCHISGGEFGGLNLEVGTSYLEITGLNTSDHAPLVISGNPDISPLIWKLEGVDNNGNNVFGSRMPRIGGPLNQTTIDIIRNWISERDVLSEISNEKSIPAQFTLKQNYPNPFNPVTIVEYALPEASEVLLVVYNLRGEEVVRLVHGDQPAGFHSVTWDATNVASGIYFYRLTAGDFVQTRNMVLLK